MPTHFAVFMPFASRTVCVSPLSMQFAEDMQSQPTNGISASWKSPWIVPSSPFFPWRTGKITSTFTFWYSPFSPRAIKPLWRGSGLRTHGTLSGCCSHLFDAISSTSPIYFIQWPFFVIPIQITSYLSFGILFITWVAETTDTSCSFDFPPKITATRILDIKIRPFWISIIIL